MQRTAADLMTKEVVTLLEEDDLTAVADPA